MVPSVPTGTVVAFAAGKSLVANTATHLAGTEVLD